MRLKKNFHWLVPQTVATQVAGGMFHYAMIENLWHRCETRLPKVELISTSRNEDGNKNLALNVCGRVCYTGQFFVQLAS